MKKLFCLILALMMVLSLCACGAKEPQQSAQQPAPQQQPAPKTAQANYKMCTNPDCESHKRGDKYPVLEFICAYCGKELE